MDLVAAPHGLDLARNGRSRASAFTSGLGG